MTKLNTAWMLNVLQQAIANTAAGEPIFVGAHPEIIALRDAGFLKIDKRKKGEEAGTFAAVATETASEVAFHAAFPAEVAQPVPAPLPVADAPQFEPAAPAEPQFEAPAPAPAPAPAAPLAPPVDQDSTEAVVIGAQGTPAVVDTVTIGDSTIAIQTGIAYVKHKPKPPERKTVARVEKYPFSVLADMKRANMQSPEASDSFVPSFHVAGVVTKNFSGNVTRANEIYENSHGVTFRATTTGVDDVNGAGVRVFCMTIAQAPARATRKVKGEVAQEAQTPVA